MDEGTIARWLIEAIPYPVLFADLSHTIRFMNRSARLEQHGGEESLTVTTRNLRVYMTPVRDDGGALVGYFERYELNQTR